jgi:hypothetical protein
MNAMDVTEILGTWQERYCVAMRAAKRLLHENSKLRERLTTAEARLTESVESEVTLEIAGSVAESLLRAERDEALAKLAVAEAERDEAKRILGLAVGRNEQSMAFVLQSTQAKLDESRAVIATLEQLCKARGELLREALASGALSIMCDEWLDKAKGVLG